MSESEFLRHEQCPSCGSRNNLARYTDGHGFCFGCEHYEPGEGQESSNHTRRPMAADLIEVGEFSSWQTRGIDDETAHKWGFSRSTMSGEPVRVFNYRDSNGRIVAQKVRTKDKDFKFLGDTKEGGLYGQHLWRDGGKMLVVTEGEIDAMSVSKMQGHKWPVVSVPTGAKGAKKALAAQMAWLDKFETVVLMFDMDDAGREASVECASLFQPGKCKVASLPLKDANEMLCAGRGKEIIDAIWGAKDYRPDGIVTIPELRDRILMAPTRGLPYFTEKLTALTFGRRTGEVVGLGAGTGIGKSDFLAQQIEFDINELKQPVGAFFLEQMPVESVKRIAGKQAGRRFHVPDGSWTVSELSTAVDKLEASGKLYLYDSFGATDWDIIKSTIRFLAHSAGVRLFYLDHLTALAAAESDERTGLERIMQELASLAKELDIWICFISHLATPDGKPHEEGGRVMIRHFKGSRAIGFWSHFMLGLERDQQHEDPKLRTITTLRVLKDRFTGNATGETIFFGYDREAGRLMELQGDPFTGESPAFGDETNTDDPF